MLVCLFSLATLCAAEDGQGASEKAREKASDQAVFNRVSDWFATVGRSDEEKERIMQERRAGREARRYEKEARRSEKKLRRKGRGAGEEMRQTGQSMRKRMGSLGKGKNRK